MTPIRFTIYPGMRDKLLLTDRRLIVYAILYANQPLTYEDIYFILGAADIPGGKLRPYYYGVINKLLKDGLLRDEKVPFSVYVNDEDHIGNLDLLHKIAQPLLYINEDKLI